MQAAKQLLYKTLAPQAARWLELLVGKRSTAVPSGMGKPFFILGSGRNGSTLLARLLNEQSELFLLPEQHALPFELLKWQLYRHQSWEQFYPRLLDRFWHNNMGWGLKDEDRVPLLEQLGSLPVAVQSAHTAYLVIQHYVAQRFHRQPRWLGDHSPLMTYFAPLLACEYPEARFLFLVRDPRDVISSYAQFTNSPYQHPAAAARRWAESAQVYAQLQRQVQSRLLLVHYESLVNSPQQSMGAIRSFLELPHAASNQQGSLISPALNPAHLDHLQEIDEPVHTYAIGKWQQQLSPEDLTLIKRRLAQPASQFGYAL